jgi:hypothetical protein
LQNLINNDQINTKLKDKKTRAKKQEPSTNEVEEPIKKTRVKKQEPHTNEVEEPIKKTHANKQDPSTN